MNSSSYSSEGQKSKMSLTGLKSKYSVGRSAFLLEALRENPFPSLFQLPEVVCIPLAFGPFFCLQSQQCLAESSLHCPLSGSLFYFSFPLQGPLWLHWGHPDNLGVIFPSQGQLINIFNSTHHLNSPLPCDLIYSEFWGLEHRKFRGAIILPTTHTNRKEKNSQERCK